MPPFIVSVRFQPVGKLYHFDATNLPDLAPGDRVIVETSRGTQLGEVVQTFTTPPPPPPDGDWKPIERRATPRELVMRQLWQKKELEATINARAAAAEMKLKGVKIIASEFSYDGSRLAILFSTETDEKLDLRDLRNLLQRGYTRSKVEMRQIGPRDVAKLIGGMGACGIAQRCCSKFLTDFSPVSIKMAKEQGISLTPSEITGMCGRLRCCLIYEYEQYVQARKTLPKRNKRVITPKGEGKVLDTYPLRDIVIVQLDDGDRLEFHKDDLQPWDELEALRRKAEAPCDRHENGECDCGKATAASKPPPQVADDFEIDDEENAGNAAVLEAIAALEAAAAPKTGGSPKDKPRGGLQDTALPKERGVPPASAAPPSAPAREPTGKPKPKKRGKPRRGGIPKAAASPQTPSPIQPSPAQTVQKAVSKKRRGKRGNPRNDGNPNPPGGAAG